MRARRARLWAIVAAVLLLCGCAAATPSGVQHVDASAVPFGLLSPAPTNSPSVRPHGPVTTIYFVKGNRLTPVRRPVLGGNQTANALRELLAGPVASEAAAGISTDVPSQTRLISLDVTGGIATVDLSEQFGNVGGANQVLAVAQLVYTVTDSPQIGAVQFAIAGKPVEVPDGSGSLAKVPRSRADYRQLAPHR